MSRPESKSLASRESAVQAIQGQAELLTQETQDPGRVVAEEVVITGHQVTVGEWAVMGVLVGEVRLVEPFKVALQYVVAHQIQILTLKETAMLEQQGQLAMPDRLIQDAQEIQVVRQSHLVKHF